MTNKRFMVPVLALVALYLPARADVVTYCGGANCTNTAGSFATALTTDGYSLGSLTAFSSSNGSLVGADYTDTASGVLFYDYLGQSLAFNGTAITTPVVTTGINYIEITLPSTIAAISLGVTVPQGVCLDAYCPAGQTTGFVGFINTNPTAPWTVEIGAAVAGSYVEFNNFSVADANSPPSPTPEVGTLLLIGAGLVSMRWMRRAQVRLFHSPQASC